MIGKDKLLKHGRAVVFYRLLTKARTMPQPEVCLGLTQDSCTRLDASNAPTEISQAYHRYSGVWGPGELSGKVYAQ